MHLHRITRANICRRIAAVVSAATEISGLEIDIEMGLNAGVGRPLRECKWRLRELSGACHGCIRNNVRRHAGARAYR